MLLGDKIKFLRQQNQLSLETLARFLNVNCDALYQWEENISLPPVEYVYRIQSFFNVSFQEYFVNNTNNSNTYAERPIEEYNFAYDDNDIKSVFKFKYLRFLGSIIIVAIFLIVISISFFLYKEYIGNLVVLGCAVVAVISYIFGFLHINNKYKNVKSNIIGKIFNYQLFSNYLKVTVFTNNMVSAEYLFSRTQIPKQWNNKDYLAFNGPEQLSEQLFIIKKQEIMNNSYIYSFMNNASAYQAQIKKVDKSTISVVLCVATIISLFLPMILLNMTVQQFHGDVIQAMLTFFYVTPIPIASIVYGIIQNVRGISNRKNIITGIIILVLLCCYGSFTFILEGMTYKALESGFEFSYNFNFML